MKTKFYLVLILFLLWALNIYAQNGWLPPVTFPNNTGMCDTAGYKLVFFDDFNGTSLDTNKWITFYSWDGMPGGDNEHSITARRDGDGDDDNYNAINLAQNVVVSNGTCKLLIKHEPASWTCTQCNDPGVPATTKYYTVGAIMTPYHKKPTQASNYFNSGKFEAKG